MTLTPPELSQPDERNERATLGDAQLAPIESELNGSTIYSDSAEEVTTFMRITRSIPRSGSVVFKDILQGRICSYMEIRREIHLRTRFGGFIKRKVRADTRLKIPAQGC